MIRHATAQDIPQVLAMGEKFHAAGVQGPKYNFEAVSTLLNNLIEGDDAVLLVSDHGMIGGMVANAYCDPNYRMAVELFWWAESGGLKLLKAFEEWAQAKSVDEVRMTSLARLERAGRLLGHIGYEPTEISYRRAV